MNLIILLRCIQQYRGGKNNDVEMLLLRCHR